MKITKSPIKIIVFIFGVILAVGIAYNLVFLISDYSSCRNTCGKYETWYNTSGCFCTYQNISIRPMYR
jgi:hypothetical protein